MKNLIISQVLCAVLLAGIGDAIPSGLRIIGGEHAGENQFPYMAALFVGQQCFCGGSIISHRHVLTAGHCTEFIPPFLLSVRLGAHNLEERSEGEQRIDVEKIIQHPRYKHNTERESMTLDERLRIRDKRNDISIVQLVEHIQFSPTVQPIRLPQPGFRGGNYGNMTLTGWGIISLSDLKDPLLKKAEILESNNCGVRTNIFCTIGNGTGYSGDSGSPVVNDGIQVGVVSAVDVDSSFNIHTRVANYASWIQSEVESSGEDILYSE